VYRLSDDIVLHLFDLEPDDFGSIRPEIMRLWAPPKRGGSSFRKTGKAWQAALPRAERLHRFNARSIMFRARQNPCLRGGVTP
jgi:hypothetical protein